MTSADGAVARAFAWLGSGDQRLRASQVLAFERIFVLVIGFEYWCRGLARWNELSTVYVWGIAGATLLCLAALLTSYRRPALAALAVMHAYVVWNEFPAAGNHAYLEVILCSLAAFLDPREEADRVLYVAAARWLGVVILFYSGLQKLVHGYYFRAEYFAFSLWIESFRSVFRLLLPAAEYQRLTAFTGTPGDGPYFVAGPLVIAISNLTYLAELLLGPALLWRPTRRFAVPATIALIVAIELAAREAFFGLLYIDLILVFLESTVASKLVAPITVVLAGMVLVRLGWLPAVTFY